MKIEMGESLFLSWLRHVKQCQVVQLNWKPSNSWNMDNEEKICELLKIFREFNGAKYCRELFGKKDGQSYNQILRQSEIDVLGFELSGNRITTAYAIDVAFHESGLNYGNRQETICRVIKKLVRSSLTMLAYFNINDGDVIFASPKISESIYLELKDVIQEASILANKNGLNFNFRIFGNGDFKQKVMSPIISLSNEIADTSELFMRSIQLHRLFDNGDSSLLKTETDLRKMTNVVSGSTNEIKIGQFVKTTFDKLLSKNLLPEDEINRLMDLRYSKKTFGLRYPALKKIQKEIPLYHQRKDAKGYPRYWADLFGNEKYLVTNDWYDRNRDAFIKWASNFEG